ncbi:hypothetical protein GCM10011317_16610 [Niveispirillum cyanobacteriorum]|nr:hypothetical protein GCM10011317_16610 [Niveispirillum cyanobacteriorum]
MTEPELNEKLQYFVSNAPFSRLAPAFVVWNPTKKERLDPLWLQERRLDFRTRLGVHLIYLDDLPPPPATSETATEKGMSADQGATEQEEDKTETDLSREMAALLERLPELVRRVDRRLKRRGAWRSIQLRLEDRLKNRQAVRLWGALALQKEVMERGINVLPRQGECSYQSPDNLVFAAAHIGQGRGALAEALMNGAEGWLRIENIYLRPTAPKDRLLINAGFSYNSNAVLNGISRFLSTRLVSGLATQSFSREASYGDGSLFQTNNPVLIIINGVDRFFSSDGTLLSAELDHLLRSIRRVKQNMVQVLLLGTERLRPYCEALGCHLNIIIKIEKTSHNTKSDNQGAVNGIDTQTLLEKICTPNRQLNSAYLEWVAERFKDFALRASNGKLSPELDITDSAAARIERALDVDRNGLNRAFFEAYLFPPLLQSLQLNCPATFEVLRTMCFIGSPIQAGILLYAPKVRSILAEDPVKGSTSIKSPNEIISELEKVVANLIKLHLLIVFEPYIPHSEVAAYRKYDAEQKVNYAQSGDPSHMGTSQLHDHGKYSARGGFIDIRADSVLRLRVGLHRSLAAFLRDRHGAPINDAKLATTFNLSMFMSNPGEDYSPEPNFHTELGDLVDSLVGAWHDILAMQKFCTSQFLKKLNKLSINKEKMPLACEEKEKIIDAYRDGVKIKNAVSKSAELQNEIQDLYSHKDSHKFIIRSIFARSSSMAASCLRAALSLVRGYYSTAALLKLDQGDRTNVDDSYGALTDHALRLDRLINGFGDCSVARTIYRKVFLAEGNSELSAEYAAHLGADPFYEDDLVWLHNERGVVALAQGNLYEARDAFGAAMEINKERVDLDYQGNYWRRIAINMVTTQIERGHLKPAERLLEQLETSIHTQVSQGEVITAGEPATMGATLRHADQIRALFHAIDRPPPIRGNSLYSRELILCVAMSTGYRATIAQMRGRYHEAKDLFEISIKMLRCLGEQRAFAHFERSYATLHIFIGEKQEALRHIEYAIAAAQSAKQMDILHRSRVVRADLWHQSFSDPRVLRQAQQDIRDALTYAAASDCYRVRIEASTSLAKHVRHGGDYDTALRYAADAMTIACRYGHAQHRTSLRIEIGQALKARGDPKSGDALLDQAVAISTGRGFHHILERVRLARNEHIPDLPTFTPPTVR